MLPLYFPPIIFEDPVRSTFLSNVFMDSEQTAHIARSKGLYVEYNPTWDLVNYGRATEFQVLYLSVHLGIDQLVQEAPKYLRPWIYGALTIYYTSVVSKNARATGMGGTVLLSFGKRF